MADDKQDKQEKAKVLLAANLEQAYLTEFLTFQDIANRVKTNLVAGLVALTKLHGGKVIGPFYARWRGEKQDNVHLFLEAFVGPARFFEAMLEKIEKGDLPKIFEEMIENKVISWDNLVAAFPYPHLMACLRESQERALKAIPATEETDIVDEEVMEVEPAGGR